MLQRYKKRIQAMPRDEWSESLLDTITTLDEALGKGDDFEHLTLGRVLAQDIERAKEQ